MRFVSILQYANELANISWIPGPSNKCMPEAPVTSLHRVEDQSITIYLSDIKTDFIPPMFIISGSSCLCNRSLGIDHHPTSWWVWCWHRTRQQSTFWYHTRLWRTTRCLFCCARQATKTDAWKIDWGYKVCLFLCLVVYDYSVYRLEITWKVITI